MGLAALRQAVADDYVRVEYIENTSNAYIDTKIIANQNTNYEIKVQFTKNTGYPYIFGSQYATKDRRFSLMEGSYNTFYYISNLHKQEINLSLTAEQQTANLTIKKDGLNIYIDDVKAGSFTNTTFTTPTSLTIFTCHFANGSIDTGHQFYGKLYYLKIYDGETLVRNFIPVLNKATDEYGMYDLVEKKFYTSPNGAKFVGGREIIYDAEIEYLESNGTQLIDTLYVPKGYNNTIETKITHLGYSNTNSWLNWFTTYVNEDTNTYRILRNKNLNTEVLVYNGNKAENGGLKINVTVGTDYDLKLYPSYLLVNGTRYNFTTLRGNENTNTLRLFGGKGTKIRMWGFKLTKGTTVILDMIPVRKDGVGYMYDKVSGKLFGNDGSGSFILGQDTVVYDKI